MADTYRIQKSTLKSMGDHVRAKGGTTALLSIPDGFNAAVDAIPVADFPGTEQTFAKSGAIAKGDFVKYIPEGFDYASETTVDLSTSDLRGSSMTLLDNYLCIHFNKQYGPTETQGSFIYIYDTSADPERPVLAGWKRFFEKSITAYPNLIQKVGKYICMFYRRSDATKYILFNTETKSFVPEKQLDSSVTNCVYPIGDNKLVRFYLSGTYAYASILAFDPTSETFTITGTYSSASFSGTNGAYFYPISQNRFIFTTNTNLQMLTVSETGVGKWSNLLSSMWYVSGYNGPFVYCFEMNSAVYLVYFSYGSAFITFRKLNITNDTIAYDTEEKKTEFKKPHTSRIFRNVLVSENICTLLLDGQDQFIQFELTEAGDFVFKKAMHADLYNPKQTEYDYHSSTGTTALWVNPNFVYSFGQWSGSGKSEYLRLLIVNKFTPKKVQKTEALPVFGLATGAEGNNAVVKTPSAGTPHFGLFHPEFPSAVKEYAVNLGFKPSLVIVVTNDSYRDSSISYVDFAITLDDATQKSAPQALPGFAVFWDKEKSHYIAGHNFSDCLKITDTGFKIYQQDTYGWNGNYTYIAYA